MWKVSTLHEIYTNKTVENALRTLQRNVQSPTKREYSNL